MTETNKTHPWRLSQTTLKEVREHKYEVAVLPCGATEPHNLHLPYGIDTLQAAEVGDRACAFAWEQGARVALLPAIPFGADQNLLEFPLTISLDQELLDRIVASVAQSLEKSGIQKLVVLNSHGGNNFKGGIRALCLRSPVFCCAIDWWQVGLAEGGRQLFDAPSLDHADEMETSILLAVAPEQVHLEWADAGAVKPSRFEAGRKGWVWYPRPWKKLTTNAGSGDPRQATAEKGRRFLALATERIGKFLVELAAAKRDETFPFGPES